MLAWLMRTDIAIKQIEKLAWDWIKLDCDGGKCYGLLAVRPRHGSSSPARITADQPLHAFAQVHRFCFALGLLHLVLALLLIGVHNTRNKRASLQNGCVPPPQSA